MAPGCHIKTATEPVKYENLRTMELGTGFRETKTQALACLRQGLISITFSY